MLFAQLGLGIPMAKGRVVIEPYVRAQAVLSDTRALLRFGFDFTVGF